MNNNITYEIDEDDINWVISILIDLFCEDKLSDEEYFNLIMSL